MRIVYVLVAVLVLKMIQNYGGTILFKFSLSFLSFPLYHIIHFFLKRRRAIIEQTVNVKRSKVQE